MPRIPVMSRSLILVCLGLAVILLASPVVVMQLYTNAKPNKHVAATPTSVVRSEAITAPHLTATVSSAPTPATTSSSTPAATSTPDSCLNRLTGTPPKSPREGKKLFVIVDVVNLRAGSSLDCPVLATLPFGEAVTAIGKPIEHDGVSWQHVRLGDERGYVAKFALKPANVDATMSKKIPVLMYHLISKHEGRFAVTPENLRKQMEWLRDNGYTSLTPSDILKAIDEGIPLPEKPVMISVDDGYASDIVFAEIVTSYGFRPVFFWPNYADLTPDQMRWLSSVGEACGHTVSHPRLREMSWDAQLNEISPNKEWIESILGKPITCFAYPFGAYDQNTTDVVAYSGYQIAFDAWGTYGVVGTVNPYHISRKEIDGDFTLDTFAAVVTAGQQ